MLMLCQQSATLLKTRLPHRRFLVFLDFTKNSAIKKHKCINDLMLLLCHQSVTYQKWDFDTGVFLWILWTFSAWNFIKNEAPAQVFSCEFWEVAQSTTLLKPRLWHKRFLAKFETFLHWLHSTTGVFLRILQNLHEHLFCRPSANGCF